MGCETAGLAQGSRVRLENREEVVNEGWVQIRKGLTGHIKSSVPLFVRVEI